MAEKPVLTFFVGQTGFKTARNKHCGIKKGQTGNSAPCPRFARQLRQRPKFIARLDHGSVLLANIASPARASSCPAEALA